MPAPCPPSAPDYYINGLHLIALISLPINTLGLYLVIYQSPGMSRYKHCLCFLQLVTFLSELQITWLSPGYFFWPMLGGYNTQSIMGSLLPVHTYMTMFVFNLASQLPAILWCFVYRHSVAHGMRATSSNNPRVVKKTSLAICHLFPFFAAFCMHKSQITVEQEFVHLSQNYPQCLFWLQNPLFIVYDYHTNKWVAVAGVSAISIVLLFCSYSFSLGFHTMTILQEFRPQMSPQTYQMHKNALISLTFQVVIPAVLVVVPVLIMFVVVLLEAVDWQRPASDSFFLMASHSCCSTLVMICTNPKFRRLIWARAESTCL